MPGGQIKKLAKTINKPVKFKRSFRGRPVKTMATEFTVFLDAPTKAFLNAIVNKERRVLHKTGLDGLRKYRRMVGRKPTKKYTKRGKMTRRYAEEIARGSRHPFPYKIHGQLQRVSNYDVSMDLGETVAGPMLFQSRATHRSTKTVPQLLNEGGTANITVWKKRTKKRTSKFAGRSKAGKTSDYTFDTFEPEGLRVKYRRLHWTTPLRDYSAAKMMQHMFKEKL